MYSFDFYWHTWQTVKGHLEIEHRPVNDRSDGRVDYWLGLVRRFAPSTCRVVEVGCAHGILLTELKERGYQCVGLEVDEKTAAWTRKATGLDVRSGVFPWIELPDCDLFLAFDVIEHSPDPVEFLRKTATLLSPGGVAILQTPIDYEIGEPPFGEMFASSYNEHEHLYVFTPESLRRLAGLTGFSVMAEDKWRTGHEVVVLRTDRGRSPQPGSRP